MFSLLFLASFATAATVQGPVFPSDLASTYRLKSYQETRSGRPRDGVPNGLDRTILQDEVSITSFEGTKACFSVVTRTSATEENAMGAWSFVVGDGQVVWPKSPEVQVFDYAYTGERVKLDLSVFSPQSGGGLRITEPEERVFRVVERTQEVCGDAVLDNMGRVTLQVLLRGVHSYDAAYVERFRWLVQR